jgi:hypothetical protein
MEVKNMARASLNSALLPPWECAWEERNRIGIMDVMERNIANSKLAEFVAGSLCNTAFSSSFKLWFYGILLRIKTTKLKFKNCPTIKWKIQARLF